MPNTTERPTALALRVASNFMMKAGTANHKKRLVESIDTELSPVVRALEHVAKRAASKHARYVAVAALGVIRGEN